MFTVHIYTALFTVKRQCVFCLSALTGPGHTRPRTQQCDRSASPNTCRLNEIWQKKGRYVKVRECLKVGKKMQKA